MCGYCQDLCLITSRGLPATNVQPALADTVTEERIWPLDGYGYKFTAQPDQIATLYCVSLPPAELQHKAFHHLVKLGLTADRTRVL